MYLNGISLAAVLRTGCKGSSRGRETSQEAITFISTRDDGSPGGGRGNGDAGYFSKG